MLDQYSNYTGALRASLQAMLRNLLPLSTYGYHVRKRHNEVLQPRKVYSRFNVVNLITNFANQEPQRFNKLYREQLKNLVYVGPFGSVQISGNANEKEQLIPIIPGLADCLGVLIKDGAGNITAAHLTYFEQYNTSSIIELLKWHNETFESPSEVSIAIAGMGGIDCVINNLDPQQSQLSELTPFTQANVSEVLNVEFPQTKINLLFDCQPTEVRPRSTQYLGTSTLPSSDIVFATN